MRKILLFLFTISLISIFAQDKIYFLNGTSRECKVLEISSENIIVAASNGNEDILRSEILLIEFKNGLVEIVNSPEKEIVYNPNSKNQTSAKQELIRNHYASVNTLALCNADISGFYEYVPQSKKIGLGVMGAYNFNAYAGAQNLFIAPLSNAKKNYDLGLTCNWYPTQFTGKTNFYIGMMIKYTSFNFDRVIKDSTSGNSSTITYIPTTGKQMATLVTIGTHTFFNEQFFLRTLAGLGAFRLRGDYKEGLNEQLNDNSNDRFNYLPKIYLGINIGFNF